MSIIDEKFVLRNFDRAIEDGDIVPFFQPVIRTLTGEICAAESLARWIDPKEGMLMPSLFIDTLEKKRLIHKLDLKIIESVCIGYRERISRGIDPVPVTVNLSRLDFDEENLFERIMDIIKKYEMPSKALFFEITESVMLDNVEVFRDIFDRIHAEGFEIWLDDFGSGYTSLNVLKDYEFDVIKLDMKFLSSMEKRSQKLVASVVNMAKILGVHTLAEGVETAEQAEFLKNIGCEMMQGFYYAKPMSAADFKTYIKEKNRPIEKQRERRYYKKAGLINILSPDPLEEFYCGEMNKDFYESLYPLALIEMTEEKLTIVYANEAYKDEIKKINLYSLEETERVVNDRTKAFYYDTKRQFATAAQTDTVIRKDYIIGDICYSFSTKYLAGTAEKMMFAVNITVFGDDGVEKRADDINKIGRSLFYNFERITMLYPDSDSSKLIYANVGFNKVYGTVSLRRGTIEFANVEMHEKDRERYLDFMNFDTLRDRILEDDCSFVQQPFRIKTPEGGYRWRLVRITFIPTADNSACYMYSIQRMPPVDIKVIEEQITKNPDMFKR